MLRGERSPGNATKTSSFFDEFVIENDRLRIKLSPRFEERGRIIDGSS